MKRWTLALGLVPIVALTSLTWAQEAPATKPKAPTVPAQKGDQPAAKSDAPSLSIGDPAPSVDVSDWLRGDKLTSFTPGKVAVVEFWATWCAPCRASIPHLSELHDRYKDYGVRFVGVSDEDVAKVKGFIESDEWVKKMRYTVGTDTDKSTYAAYMTAAGQSGIPTAFIVGKTGKVEWIGHPMGMDEPLDKIVNDKWDTAAYKKQYDAEAATEAARKALYASLMEAQAKSDWDGMVKLLDGHLKSHVNDSDFAMMRMQILLTKANKPEAGYEAARDIAAKNGDNPIILNQIAWTIVDAPGIEKRDYALATEIAQKANKKTGEKDPMILDTLARCYWESGDHAKAIELQKKAVGLTEDPRLAGQLKETLEKYESSK